MSAPVRCIWPVEAMLGEAPIWDAREQCVWFVDIRHGLLHRCAADGSTRQSWPVSGQPSFVLPAEGGGLVIGNGHDLLHWQAGACNRIASVAMRAKDRFNDATVDRMGRIWFGSMDDGETEHSGMVRLFDRGIIEEAGGQAVITNGPAISTCGRWLYHVDTRERTIWRFGIGCTTRLENGMPFATIALEDGWPDGVTIDAEDHVWVGLWGGWAARRYAPDGTLAGTIRFPCANITKVAFGGPDLRTAFVTSARSGLDPVALEAQPLAGGLFAFEAPAPGHPLSLVRLSGIE